MKRIIGIMVIAFCISYNANAQHERHQVQDTTKPKMQMQDSMNTDHMEMNHMNHMNMNKAMNPHMPMSHVYSLNLPMGRNGSGTGWLPDASPMYGYMFHTPKWMYMLHYNLFFRYNNQDFTNKGSRGDSKIDAPDWVMLMAQHQVGKNGLFHYNIMSSLDALTGGNGYPLLFKVVKPIKEKQLLTGSIHMICFPNYL